MALSCHCDSDRRPEELSMRTVIAQIYDYSVDGISAVEDSSFSTSAVPFPTTRSA